MQPIAATGPVPQSFDDADLRPIPLGPRTVNFLRPSAPPPAWEPVVAVARALGRLQQLSPQPHQEVRLDARIQRVAERQP